MSGDLWAEVNRVVVAGFGSLHYFMAEAYANKLDQIEWGLVISAVTELIYWAFDFAALDTCQGHYTLNIFLHILFFGCEKLADSIFGLMFHISHRRHNNIFIIEVQPFFQHELQLSRLLLNNILANEILFKKFTSLFVKSHQMWFLGDVQMR